MLLKQSTAINLTILLVQSSDHITGKTGATLTIYASKAAGVPAAITPTVTELDSTNMPGVYKLALTTTHTNTLGELALHITASGADPTDVQHQVIAIDLGTIIENQVWDATMASHTTSGTTGASLNGAGSAGDPWNTALPGAYASGTAGNIVGNRLDAAVSTRLAASSYTAPDNADIAAIKTKTDSLTFTVAGKVDSNVIDVAGTVQTARDLGANLDVAVSTRLAGSSYTAPDNADIAAIKAKTDNLPASPAATGAQMDLVNAPNATALNAAADALLDRASGVESGRTLRQAARLWLAALAGKLSGAATTTVVIRDTNDTKDRITATVDSNGNRSAITYDVS